jgi:phospholipase/lecithinase/hemolysin
MRIFGDGVSTTTNNPSAGQYYYGLRRSNGRVWVEVLAQRLGLGANSITNVNWSNNSNNWSFYGQDSTNLVPTIRQYVAPSDVSTALFVVWVNDADFVADMQNIYPSTNAATWTFANNQSLTNHYIIITNLYAKGVRTLLMPNAVDITEIPQYDSLQSSDPPKRTFIRQQVASYNTDFATMLNRAQTNSPGLAIYSPDFFNLLDKVLTNAAAYGLTNARYLGVSIDALDDPALVGKVATNGPGTNYIFWDQADPTAKFHEVIADSAQQVLAPPIFTKVTRFASSNLLNMTNLPVGLSGFVDSITNLTKTNWAAGVSVTSTNTAQSLFVTNSGPVQFYRLQFPYSWKWP